MKYIRCCPNLGGQKQAVRALNKSPLDKALTLRFS